MTGVCVQEDRLWVADPKAINHILHKSGYLYAKPNDLQEQAALLTDRGIVSVGGESPTFLASSSFNDPTGEVHKRHRRAMAPAFGLVESKGLLPYFMDAATKACEPCLHISSRTDPGPRAQMADKWSNVIANGKSWDSATIDVNLWFGKATLDACVLVSEFGMDGLRTDHKPISKKDRRWRFRVRLWGPRRDRQPVYRILQEHNVRSPTFLIHGPIRGSNRPGCANSLHVR